MSCLTVVRTVSLLLILTLISPAFARDLKTAEGYLAEAKQKVEARDYELASKKIELAEAELDGVDAAAKAPAVALIAELKKQIAETMAAGDRAKYERELERVMSDGERAIGNLVIWKGAEDAANELFNNPAAKAALGEDLTKAQTKFATFKKLHVKKAAVELATEAEAEMKSFDEKWTESKTKLADPNLSPEGRASLLEDVRRAIESANASVAKLSPDDAKAKEYTAKLKSVGAEVSQMSAAGDAQDYVNRINRGLDSYKEDWAGWENEGAGPSWEEFQKTQSEAMSNFNNVKSAKMLSRVNSLIEEWEKDDAYKAVANTPAVKALVDKVKADRDAAKAKILKNATTLVEGAEKAGPVKENISDWRRLEDDIRLALDSAPEAKPLQDRIQAIGKKFTENAAAADKALDETYKKLTEQSAAAWPGMKAKFSIESGFDPAKYSDFKGKTISITTDNLMGWRFKPGDFPFATTLNGHAIAGKYAPEVASAIAEVEAKVKHGLGDIDNDGKWEIIATVDGNTGKLMAKRQAEGDVTVDGRKVGTVTSDYSEAVDAPIITIVAAHCGPLAVAVGQGAVKEDGKIAAPTGAVATATSSSGGWGTRILMFLVGLTAALVCLIKAKFSPLVSLPQVGQVSTQVGANNLSLIGLACAALGLLWFLMDLMHFFVWGMLVTLSILAAGLYAGLDFLEARGIVKPAQTAAFKSLGVPIGLACAVLVILALI